MDKREVVGDIDYWAGRIRGHLARTVEGIVAAGRDLQAAKDGLPHGEWLPLLAEVGLHPRSVQLLTSVADHPVLANARHASHLPASWDTLSRLARLPEPDLRAVIDAGEVRPDMKRADAVALVSPTPSRR